MGTHHILIILQSRNGHRSYLRHHHISQTNANRPKVAIIYCAGCQNFASSHTTHKKNIARGTTDSGYYGFETWIILGVKTNTNSSFSTFSLPPLLGDHLSHLNVIHLVHRHHLYNGQTTYIVAKNITENSSNIPSCNSCTMLQTFLAHLPFNLLLRAPSPSKGSHPLPIVQFV